MSLPSSLPTTCIVSSVLMFWSLDAVEEDEPDELDPVKLSVIDWAFCDAMPPRATSACGEDKLANR